jgi:hypothetical protein
MEHTIQNTRGALLGKKVVPSRQGSDISLEKGELFRLESGPHPQLILVVDGRVWITEAGTYEDIILEKGETHQITGTGMALIQGIPVGRIRFY